MAITNSLQQAPQLPRTTFASFMLKGGQIVLQIALVVLLVRLLGAETYGQYAFLVALALTLTAPAGAAVHAAATRYAVVYAEQGQWSLLRGFGQRLIAWTLLYGAGAAFVVFALGMLGVGVPNMADTVASVVLLALFVVLLPLLRLASGLLRGRHRVLLAQVGDILLRPAGQVLVLALLTVGLGSAAIGLDAALLSLLIATLAALVFSLVVLQRQIPPEVRAAPPRTENRQWLRSLFPISVTGGLLVVNAQVDTLMVGALASDAETGLYKIAAQASTLTAFALQAFTPVYAPLVARLNVRRDYTEIQRTVARASLAILLITLLPAALLMAMGDRLLVIAFGPEFAGAHLALAILCVGQLINAGCGFTGVILEMTGRERDATLGVAMGLLTNVLLNAALIPSFGIVGAAVATASGLVVWNLMLVWAIHRRLGISVTALAALMPRKAV